MSKILKVFGILVIVVCLGLALGWFATRSASNRNQAPPPVQVSNTTVEVANPHPPPTHAVSHPIATGPVVRNTANAVEVSPGDVAHAPSANAITNWEDKLDDILGSEGEDTNKVKELFEMFPRLPKEGQVEVAQHLSNLVEDDAYAPLGKLLLDPKMPEDVLDILMADLLNRPNTVKLPMFLDIARTPDHAKAGEAKDLLELYLDEDYGTDWDKWQKKMGDWLKENPD